MANAGHNYPILLDESVHELVLDGLPLGIDGEYAYGETSARLKPGDVLVLYTDGVVEAVNPANEPFGFERLFQLLTESCVRRPRTLTRQIVRAVRSFSGATPQSDDITLLVLRRRHEDRVREMCEVAEDVLGMEGGDAFREKLEGLHLAPDAPLDAWRTAIMNVAAFARERWGQGVSRELTQQLLLTLEGF
jgi:sigma-B regulation protein RsbU (phosphoserine phosphatase)